MNEWSFKICWITNKLVHAFRKIIVIFGTPTLLTIYVTHSFNVWSEWPKLLRLVGKHKYLFVWSSWIWSIRKRQRLSNTWTFQFFTVRVFILLLSNTQSHKSCAYENMFLSEIHLERKRKYNHRWFCNSDKLNPIFF